MVKYEFEVGLILVSFNFKFCGNLNFAKFSNFDIIIVKPNKKNSLWKLVFSLMQYYLLTFLEKSHYALNKISFIAFREF